MSGRALRWLLSLGHVPGGARARPARLVIVRHHRVYADGERALYALGVGESVLAGQLDACARAGLAPTSVREGLDWLARARAGTRVAFTFDDGYADNVTRALPLLLHHGARATFYLTAGLMEERRAPWWDELTHVLEHGAAERATLSAGGVDVALERATPAGRAAALRDLLPLLRVPPQEQRARLDLLRGALRADGPAPCAFAGWAQARTLAAAGMELGAHTLTHPFLSLLPAEAQLHELRASAELVRERTGAQVDGAAYPNGDHDAVTVAAAAQAGFAHAVVTRSGDCVAATALVEPGRLTLPRRPLTAGACTGPGGRFSRRMTLAEIGGAFDRLRGRTAEVGS